MVLPEMISAFTEVFSETFQYMTILSFTELMYIYICVLATLGC